MTDNWEEAQRVAIKGWDKANKRHIRHRKEKEREQWWESQTELVRMLFIWITHVHFIQITLKSGAAPSWLVSHLKNIRSGLFLHYTTIVRVRGGLPSFLLTSYPLHWKKKINKIIARATTLRTNVFKNCQRSVLFCLFVSTHCALTVMSTCCFVLTRGRGELCHK